MSSRGPADRPRMCLSDRERLRSFSDHGYFIVRGFLDPAEARDLRRSCDTVLDQVRATSSELGHTSTHIAGLTDPRYFSGDPAALTRLVDLVGSARVCALLHDLGRAEEGTLRVADTHYYHEQTRRDWDGDWHRDSQFGRPDPSAEEDLALTTTALHFRVALVADDRLELVPGSHARWDTPEELQIRKGAGRNKPNMKGATRVALEPGDACVFHAWGIHRGTYHRAPVRRTFDVLYKFGRPAAPRPWPAPP